MAYLSRIFDIYIKGSIHVGLAAFSFVMVTNQMFHIDGDPSVAGFVFAGTITAYNFIKYSGFFKWKQSIRKELRAIFIITILASLASGCFFVMLKGPAKLLALLFFGIAVLYTLPIFSGLTNLRNLAGVKIYIVALCWAGITTLLPAVNAAVYDFEMISIRFVQRFSLVLILILIFDIIDLRRDDPMLRTIPQQFGMKRTKYVASLLLLFYLLPELVYSSTVEFAVSISFALVIFLFVWFANPSRPSSYTSLWVEAMPLLWLILRLIFYS